jgi:thiamine biosynthesis lipoprotein
VRAEERFEAMGTWAHVLVFGGGATRLVRDAVARIEQLESRWSRFRPASELSRLNANAGTPAIVSPDTLRLVQCMRVGHSVTEGAFDPAILPEITRLGYDRDFKRVVAAGNAVTDDARVTRLRDVQPRRFADVTVSPKSAMVWLPAGVGIDPGGIGKGLAADIVAEELRAAGAQGALVNLGGDLRVIGRPDDAECWYVDLEDPISGDAQRSVALVDGGLASSSTEKRAWKRDGRDVHHLIDPGTGTSTDRAIVGATVIAREAWRAEVLTKACIVRGSAGLELVDRFGAAAQLVRRDGRRMGSAMWRRHEIAGAR